MSTVCPDDVAVTKANAPACQFRLAHLFGLTTLCAIAAALVAAWGIGTLPMSVGLIAAWLNWCGAFRVVQAGWQQQTMLWLAWGTFLLSLVLPSLTVFDVVYGWAAAWFVFCLPWEAIRREDSWILTETIGLLWYLLLNVANCLVALLPLLIWRVRRGRGQWSATALCLAMIAPWSVAWDGQMLVGYFVWSGSFVLSSIALPIGWRTLAGMLAMAGLIAALAWLIG